MNDKEMSMVDHLSELRKRLIWVISFFILFMIIGFVVAPTLVEHLKNDPAASNISWHVFGFSDALRIYMQVAFIIAVILTLPVILFHVWRFMSPGLTQVEQRALLIYIPFAIILLLLGLSFGYYILLPMIIGFMSNFTFALGAEETYGLTQYFQFMFNLILPVSLLFELPVVILFLTTIRVVNPMILKKFRKYSILIFVTIAALVTPPDFISNILVSIPLIALYEISIWLSGFVYRKQKERDKEWEEEFAIIKTDD
ncbi:twin-arginine translocase subunit TatC [Ammoniphilus sp. CFH 90114]|uniref:twin-arginine translocase subunit TatC n=1 Tax=Ammoniphilus sp. CFH 90114 TaxID=2493665 RepID=UPI00100F9A97|nr:twin-arginine translocase subunit TatC [Ammoniphilus sp. CFH 90114]RXT05187.1 twin-arginine translocase subunit TatC [Ammoniphilus sp. CFH 90114]